MFKEPNEPSMFDEIQMVVLASPNNVGKVFCVLNENLRLCLICDEVFTRQGAAEHATTVCYFPEPRNDGWISAEANQSSQPQQSPKLS